MHYDIKEKKTSFYTKLNEKAANVKLCSAHTDVAFTIDNNIYINTGSMDDIAVTIYKRFFSSRATKIKGL